MSSNRFSSQLRADDCLRIAVVVSGDLFAVLGLLLLLLQPLPLSVRGLACLAWLAHVIFERSRLAIGYRRHQALRIDHRGGVTLQLRNRSWVPAELCAGSLVLRKLAWLRVKSERGERFAELFIATRQNATQWRHLQVIWRHIGAAA